MLGLFGCGTLIWWLGIVSISIVPIQNTTVSTGTIDIDTLSACSCPNPEVYWLLRQCDAPNATQTSAQDLCNQTTITTIYTNASTLASSTTIFDGLGCLQGFAFPIYLSVTPSDPYYYWDGSSLAGPYTQACP